MRKMITPVWSVCCSTLTVTSQLALLTNDEYTQGIRQIQRDIEAAEARNEVLTLRTDLRLYATIGWVA
jgi:hypothetical protein